METRSNHVWVGAVTLALLAALAAFVIWIARLGQGDQHEYDIFFHQSVDGLSKGSAVSYSGVPVGQVKGIELWRNDPGFVRVRIALDAKTPVTVGTTATIQSGFTGVSNIQLEGGLKGAAPLTQLGPDGVPVIPTKRGGLGELLASAPVLLDRLAVVAERLDQILSEKNQEKIGNILSNTDRLTGNLADASPQVKATLTELNATLAQAQHTLAAFETTAGSVDGLVNGQGAPLAQQLTETLKSAKTAADQLQAVLGDARPATRRLNTETLPAAEAAIRELKSATKALRDVSEKVDAEGGKALLGGGDSNLPEYKP